MSMIDVAIRFDDPSAVSDHALERAILHAMACHGVCATFATIPHAGQHALSADDVPHLVEARQSGRLEIAQHGFSHESCRPGGSLPSEFAGLDRAAQTDKITAGRSTLEQVFGVAIRGFVPPFNTFDQVTASILSDQDFLYLSAGGEHGLADAAQTLEDLAELFQWLRQQSDVRLNTLSQLAARHDARTWYKAVRRTCWVQRRHWRIRSVFPRYSLMPHALFKYVRLTGIST